MEGGGGQERAAEEVSVVGLGDRCLKAKEGRREDTTGGWVAGVSPSQVRDVDTTALQK